MRNIIILIGIMLLIIVATVATYIYIMPIMTGIPNSQAPIPVIKQTKGTINIPIEMTPENLSLNMGLQTFTFSSKNTFLVSSESAIAYLSETKVAGTNFTRAVFINFTVNTPTNLVFNDSDTFVALGVNGLGSNKAQSVSDGNINVEILLPGKYELIIAPYVPPSPAHIWNGT